MIKTKYLILIISLVMTFTGQVQAQQSNSKPLVKIIATGGTIANSPDGRMSVETVMQQVPEVDMWADIEVYDYIRVGSSEITVQNWIDIAKVISRELEQNDRINGVVVTHGSNTSEETAYFLNLVLDTDKPVVVVGAQRQRGTLSEDSSRNFYDAIRVAAHPDAGGRGVMLIANEMIHFSRDVTKTMSYRVETWDSGDLGVLGFSDLDMIKFYRNPTTLHTTSSQFRLNNIDTADDLPRVEIVYSYADAGPEMIEAAVANNAKGIVFAGFPTGSGTPAMNAALAKAQAAGIAVVNSHRGGRGRIQTNRPFISADNLTVQKARILLMLALAHNVPVDRLEEVFSRY
jgi:L-asparaginase